MKLITILTFCLTALATGARADLEGALAATVHGNQNVSARHYQAALKNYRLALKEDPDYFPALKAMALCYEKMGEESLAISTYERYLAANSIDYRTRDYVNELKHRNAPREVPTLVPAAVPATPLPTLEPSPVPTEIHAEEPTPVPTVPTPNEPPPPPAVNPGAPEIAAPVSETSSNQEKVTLSILKKVENPEPQALVTDEPRLVKPSHRKARKVKLPPPPDTEWSAGTPAEARALSVTPKLRPRKPRMARARVPKAALPKKVHHPVAAPKAVSPSAGSGLAPLAPEAPAAPQIETEAGARKVSPPPPDAVSPLPAQADSPQVPEAPVIQP